MEIEKHDLRGAMEMEVAELQQNLKRLQHVSVAEALCMVDALMKGHASASFFSRIIAPHMRALGDSGVISLYSRF